MSGDATRPSYEPARVRSARLRRVTHQRQPFGIVFLNGCADVSQPTRAERAPLGASGTRHAPES